MLYVDAPIHVSSIYLRSGMCAMLVLLCVSSIYLGSDMCAVNVLGLCVGADMLYINMLILCFECFYYLY